MTATTMPAAAPKTGLILCARCSTDTGAPWAAGGGRNRPLVGVPGVPCVIVTRRVSDSEGYTRPGIAGSGAIACGLAACASALGNVRLWARSDVSAWRAEERAEEECAKGEAAVPRQIRVTTNLEDLAGCDLIVESVKEDLDVKVELLRALGDSAPDADLASTTSSLPVRALGKRSGHAERVFGLHVFNPVQRMELIELCLPDALRDGIRDRARAWCGALQKTPVEVPDQPGFVVNRLLFPYLFDAVRLLERTGMAAADVDACMQLGAGHPMGPLRLLDFIGLDVAAAIGQSLFEDAAEERYRAPGLIEELIRAGKLGRKSGEGFYQY
jgi:3-hydroxybutyryl-CoA dehydrogenase